MLISGRMQGGVAAAPAGSSGDWKSLGVPITPPPLPAPTSACTHQSIYVTMQSNRPGAVTPLVRDFGASPSYISLDAPSEFAPLGTALHHASSLGHLGVVRALLEVRPAWPWSSRMTLIRSHPLC